MTTPEQDPVDGVEAAKFLISMGGYWRTDCKCRTVTDLERVPSPDLVYEPEDGKYAVSYTDYWPLDGNSVVYQGHSVDEAIEIALDHPCDPPPPPLPERDPAP